MKFLSIKEDNLPYLFTVIAALLTWALKHTVDRILLTPAIEYKIQIKRNTDGVFKHIVYFSNITSNNRFADLILFIQPLQRVTYPKWKPDKLMMIKNEFPALDYDSIANTISLNIKEFQPRQKFSVEYCSASKKTPLINYSNGAPLYLVTPSLSTFLMKNESLLIILILLVCLTFSIVFLKKISQNETSLSDKSINTDSVY